MYKFTITLFLLIYLSLSAHANDNNYEQERLASIKKATLENDSLSDEKLFEFLRDMFKYLPEAIEDLNQESPTERKKSLNNFRKFYTNADISIPELIENYKQFPELKESMAKTWFNDILGVEYAEKVLFSLSKQEYQTIIDMAKSLIKNNKRPFDKLGRAFIHENFPKQLDYIKIEYLVIHKSSFDLYLYKGIGGMKSIGFKVIKEGDKWVLYQFNYLKSWDNNLIDLNSLEE